MSNPDVLVIGVGLAGLTCDRHLHRHGLDMHVLEASDRVGGRVRTDTVDGFRLDRGFQVFLTAYPSARLELNYESLDLHAFYDGALVRYNGQFHRIADPYQHPLDGLRTLVSPIGTGADKLRVARMRRQLTRQSLPALLHKEERTTLRVLRERWGLSSSMIDRFFRPFFGGIFFDRSLGTSSRMFEFLFKMFAEGETVLPAGGMEQIPQHLRQTLPEGALHLNTPVERIEDQTVTLEGGKTLGAPALVVATEAPEADRLVGNVTPTTERSTVCVYYAAPDSPLDDPLLVLNGDGVGPVNNVAVPSDVAPGYAPEEKALVAAVVVGDPEESDDDLEHAVRQQLIDWFGLEAGGWRHLQTMRIPYALPD